MATALTTQRLLYPFHLAVLATLHAVLATSRATRLALRLGRLVLRPSIWIRNEPASLSDDLAAQRWSKLPRHLAVSLVCGGNRSREEDRKRHVGILESLLHWSRQLGVATLSVYDETGALLRNAAGYAKGLDLQIVSSDEDIATEGMVTLAEPWVTAKRGAASPPASEGTRTPRTADEDASADSSTTLVADETYAASPRQLRLNLLSRDAGRPRLARLAQELAVRARETGDDIQSEQIAEQIDALPLGEPDLLLVLGGSYLRLHGFPPWQLRLTEMYHHSWPTWFSKPPELTYDILRKALDVYGRAEMRLGR
ncbi:hypothetical protein JCM10908_002480 [Rhodotorula pacifica]|uniref:ditrans,polycis-polyprenyl diphosphate synthase n=1 Tax=Rhodotorula pacifica TaxID=1495444 RepID=UPI00316B9D40